MKPFDTAQQAMDWIKAHASGDCECYVWSPHWLVGGILDNSTWSFV